MSKIKDENYYQISGWMVNRLGLKGSELQVFAIIYGFSQDGESKFTGSINYLCDWLGVSRPTAMKTLKELTDREFIIKETEVLNGVTFNHYRVNLPYVANFTGSKDSLLGGSKESLHYNNTTIDNNSNVVSKDTTLYSRSGSETSSSRKLFSSAKSQTRKSSVQKTNTFITTCQREAVKKEFSEEVLAELDKYFRMLAEMNTLLPAVSIAEQLACLAKVPKHRQIVVVKNTVSRGWKSLQYEADAVTKGKPASGSSFVDTASPGTFHATPEEDKNGDWKKNIPEDHIF